MVFMFFDGLEFGLDDLSGLVQHYCLYDSKILVFKAF